MVGKYTYTMLSPHEDIRAPLIVDVLLVGRTKVLKIHSALYLQVRWLSSQPVRLQSRLSARL